MSSYKGRGGHRHTSQMTDSPSLSHHTSECNFSATKHSPTGEELKNNVKSPTTNYRRFLEQDILIDEDDDDDNKLPHAQNLSKDDDIRDDLKGNHAFRTAGGTGRLDFGGGNNFPDFDEDDYIQLPHAQDVLNDEDDTKFSSTPTDEEIINNTKTPPTARQALEVKAMKFIAETFFLYPYDPAIPLVQFNAPNDIRKLNDDELITLTTDEDALFSWSYDQLTAQDGWLTNAPSTPNIDDEKQSEHTFRRFQIN